MTTIKKMTTYLIALLILHFSLSGCGTQCGNPFCPADPTSESSLAGPDNTGVLAAEVATPFGVASSKDISTFSGITTFENTLFSYGLVLPDGWTVSFESNETIVFTNNIGVSSSIITIVATELLEPITDLIDFVSLQENQIVGDPALLTTGTLNGAFLQKDELTIGGGNLFEVFFTNDLTLLTILVERNAASDGDNEVDFIMTTLTFLPDM